MRDFSKLHLTGDLESMRAQIEVKYSTLFIERSSPSQHFAGRQHPRPGTNGFSATIYSVTLSARRPCEAIYHNGQLPDFNITCKPPIEMSHASPIEMSREQVVVETFGVTCDDGDPNERPRTDPASYHDQPGGQPDHIEAAVASRGCGHRDPN